MQRRPALALALAASLAALLAACDKAPAPAAAPSPPAVAAAPAAVLYSCTGMSHSDPIYMRVDQGSKSVSEGRAKDKLDITTQAFFNSSGTVTWSRPVGDYTANLTFHPDTGQLEWGWGTGMGQSGVDSCKPI